MGAPNHGTCPSGTRADLHPTGAHGLVARPYEPLADSRAGTHGPTKPVLCSRFREHIEAGRGFDLASASLERTRAKPAPLNEKRSYLTSTLAPASSSFFLTASASALLMPSFTGFGAPSTRSLAS